MRTVSLMHNPVYVRRNLFGSSKPEAALPDLRNAWNDVTTRRLLERVILQGVFQDSPGLGANFLMMLGILCTSMPVGNEEIYTSLAEFLRRPENKRPFDATYLIDEENRFQRRVQQILDLVPEASKPQRYVDIGCGNGKLTGKLAEKWCLGQGQVMAIEVFPQPGTPNIGYTLFNGQRVPLKSDAFDLATLFAVLHHAEDPDALIREAFRVLKPGGRLIVREMNARTEGEKLFHNVMDHLYYRVFNNLPGIPTPANHMSADEWRTRFEAAGFRVEQEVAPEPDNPFNPIHFVLVKPGPGKR